MVNRMGPRTDPCGTPYFNSCGSDVDFLIWTVWVRPVRYDWNQSKTLPLIPNDDSSVWSKRWWSIVSNAALRSKLLSFFWLTYYCSIGLCFSVRVYLSLFRSTCKLIQSLFLQWFVPKKASVPKKADKLNLSLSWIFKVKFWKSHIRNGMADWHGIKGIWIDRMLDPCCDCHRSPHPWPSPWIFKVKFWKSHILWMGWPIDMERNGCESIECSTHDGTFNIHLFYDLDLGFSRSYFEKVLSQEWDGWLTWNKSDVSR